MDSDDKYRIRYAGTGELCDIDSTLLDNSFACGVPVHDLNLLSYLMERMDDEQLESLCETVNEYNGDLLCTDIDYVINGAYMALAGIDEDEGFDDVFDGSNVTELIEAERELLQSYPEMNTDVDGSYGQQRFFK